VISAYTSVINTAKTLLLALIGNRTTRRSQGSLIFKDYLSHSLLSGHNDSFNKYVKKYLFTKVTYCSFKYF